MEPSVEQVRFKLSRWIVLPFVAYVVWQISDSVGRLLPVWSDWRASGGAALSANQEYVVWSALGGISFSLLLPIPLLMQHVRGKRLWALGVLWVAFFAGELAVDHFKDDAYARRVPPACSPCCESVTAHAGTSADDGGTCPKSSG